MESSELIRRCREINAEVNTLPIVVPSKFWDRCIDLHTSLLLKHGIENFKRTVAHNYANWLVISQGVIRDKMAALSKDEIPKDEMEDPGDVGFKDYWTRGNHALELPQDRLLYRLWVSLLWDHVAQSDIDSWLDKIDEPLVGNPIKIWRGSKLLAQDLAHSVYERNVMSAHLPKGRLVIGELGAGQARLAHVFNETVQCSQYFVFDIAPALVVSEWYIRKLYPDEKVFGFRHFDAYDQIESELSECKFAFFSANQLEKMPDQIFDLFINICSLAEMRKDTIAYFIGQIGRTTKGLFYTKQWIEQNNKIDMLKIDKDDYPIPSTWSNLLDRTDDINRRLFEQIWRPRSN